MPACAGMTTRDWMPAGVYPRAALCADPGAGMTIVAVKKLDSRFRGNDTFVGFVCDRSEVRFIGMRGRRYLRGMAGAVIAVVELAQTRALGADAFHQIALPLRRSFEASEA